MKRLIRIAVWAAVVLWPALSARAQPFVAYSLLEAQHRLASGKTSTASLSMLGGITHLAGAVYDAEHKDLIIVGKCIEGAPSITLDDLVVAFRSVFVDGESPLVSIDRTAETKSTGMQLIRYEGGIENTQMGMDMFEADLLLKKLAMGKEMAEVWGVQSYIKKTMDDIVNRQAEDRLSSRFWLENSHPPLAIRNGVFVMHGLDFQIETEVLGAVINGENVEDVESVVDLIGEQFAEEVESCFSDLAVQYPVLSRVKPILAMVALAQGVQELETKPALDYWLQVYRVKVVKTPNEQELLKTSRTVQDRKVTHTFSGGIRLNPLVFRLRNGEVSALREAVLQSRPSPDTLVWNPPLTGWHIPGADMTTTTGDLIANLTQGAGFSLDHIRSHEGNQEVSGALPGSFFGSGIHAKLPEFLVKSRLPIQHLSSDIGGVMLSGTAQGPDHAQVNLAGGNFSLVVDGKNARIDPRMYRKFITALWSVYYSDRDPGISIDPPKRDSDKKKDKKYWTKADRQSVRYIGRVLNTDLGRVMREADYLMKKWAVGTEQPNYPGFFSVDRYEATLGVENTGVATRFWFVPEDLSFRRGGELLLFDAGRIQLNTEYDQDGMRGKASAADEKFADFFTRHYNGIAAKNPIFQELFEYAKLVSLAKYLKEQGVPLHWFLMANKDLVLMEDSPLEVDGLLQRSDYVRGLVVKGGVNLAATPTYKYDAEAVAAIENMMSQIPAVGIHTTGLPGGVNEVRRVPTRFSFDLGKQSYSVVPQHTLTSGKGPRGIRYQTDLAMRQNGRPGLELVRYYNPRNREGGEFGKGWHLLIPYRVKPAGEERTEFLNVVIPKQMTLENLCTGEQEVLNFSEDGDDGAGYVPERPSSSQIVRLLLMSDASYRLVDKLGNQFQFDQGGYLTDMRLSPNPAHHVHVEYVGEFTDAFDKKPYVVRPVDKERVVFRNMRVPKRVKVTDLLHGDSEVLTFSKENRIVGYVPENKNTSRFRLAALLSNTGLQLVDKHGNESVFDPDWKFENMLPSRERRMVRSVSMGGQKATFRYTINGAGEVMIASASLSKDQPGAQPTHVVRYEHDDEGRLCRVRHTDVPGLAIQRGRENDLAMTWK